MRVLMPKPSRDLNMPPVLDLVVKGFDHITDLALKRAILDDIERNEDSAAAIAVGSEPRRRQPR